MTAPISADEARRLREEIQRGPLFPEHPAIVDIDHAIAVALEQIEEWDHADDPHGWCHQRPILLTLAATVERLSAEVERLAALAGQHDPTGADHMEEMWVHAQRADAAEATVERLSEVIRAATSTFDDEVPWLYLRRGVFLTEDQAVAVADALKGQP